MSDKLRKSQIESGIAEGNVLMLKKDVPTRWNWKFYMIERFLRLRKIVADILIDDANGPQMLSSAEFELSKQLLILLKPFEFMTRDISGENYVTLSKIIPMVNCLLSQIEKFTSKIPAIEAAKECLLNELNKRFGQTEHNTVIAISTILDPRFKDLHFQNKSALSNAAAKIRACMNEVQGSGSNDTDNEELTESTEQTDEDIDFWGHHKQLVHEKPNFTDDGDELVMYLSTPVNPLEANPLTVWEDMKTIYPGLYKLARLHMVHMATSVPCERLFSKTGATVTEARNRISSTHLEKVVFLGSIDENEWFN